VVEVAFLEPFLEIQTMKMYFVFALSLFLSAQAARASDYNEVCLNRYRDAAYLLIDAARSFNSGDIGSAQMLAEFSLIESQIGAKRLICALEEESIKDCVRLYKKQYKKIRDEIDMIAIGNGDQTKIRLGLVEAGLGIADLRCQ
jgi:hypothetical protein